MQRRLIHFLNHFLTVQCACVICAPITRGDRKLKTRRIFIFMWYASNQQGEPIDIHAAARSDILWSNTESLSQCALVNPQQNYKITDYSHHVFIVIMSLCVWQIMIRRWVNITMFWVGHVFIPRSIYIMFQRNKSCKYCGEHALKVFENLAAADSCFTSYICMCLIT